MYSKDFNDLVKLHNEATELKFSKIEPLIQQCNVQELLFFNSEKKKFELLISQLEYLVNLNINDVKSRYEHIIARDLSEYYDKLSVSTINFLLECKQELSRQKL